MTTYEANVDGDRNRRLVWIVYLLQGLSLFTFWIPALIAVVICYVKRPDIQGAWLASHLRWQIQTFWFMLAWIVLSWLSLFVFGFGSLIFLVASIWYIYRVVRGWLYLSEQRSMPMRKA